MAPTGGSAPGVACTETGGEVEVADGGAVRRGRLRGVVATGHLLRLVVESSGALSSYPFRGVRMRCKRLHLSP